MAAQTTFIPVPLPKGGVDRSGPEGSQPPDTCFDALNVDAYQYLSDRYTLGKRAGTTKAFTPAATGGKVTGLQVVERIPQPAGNTDSTNEKVVDDLTKYPGPQSGGATTIALDPLGNYVLFYKKSDASDCRAIDEAGVALVNALPAAWLLYGAAAAGNLNKEPGAAITYPIVNDVKATLNADTYLAGSDTTTQHGCSNVGPFIRASNDLSSKLVAYLEWTGYQNSCRLVIEWLTGATATKLATGKTLSLKGLDGASNMNPGCAIRLYEDKVTNEIVATVSWPGGGAGGVEVADTVRVTTANGAGNSRGGVMYRTSRLSTTGYVQASHSRFLTGLEYTRKVPYAYPKIVRAQAAEFDPIGGNAFVIPLGFRESVNTPILASVPATTAGPNGAAAADAVSVRFDTGANKLVSLANTNRATRTAFMSYDTAPAVGVIWGVDLFYRSLNTGAGDDTQNPLLNLSVDHRYCIRVELDRTIATAPNAGSTSEYTRVRLCAIYSNAAVRTRAVIRDITYPGTTPQAPIFSLYHPVRWSYEAGYIRARQNGILLFEYLITGDVNWTGNVATTVYGLYVGVDLSNDTGATVAEGRGFEITNLSPTLSAAVPAGTDIVVCSASNVQVGQLATPATLSACSGGGFAGSIVHFARILGKLYAVDGTTSKVIDPVALSVNDWLNVTGTEWDRCPVTCAWRGRIFLGGPPRNGALWVCTAINAPTDLNLGSGLSTGAYSGDNAEVGQPGDNIVALIPHSADYLLFMCRREISLMRGDPGAGGRVERLSKEAGILGSRAWCYDDQENLYWVGTGGLYVMPKGGLVFTPVSGRRTSVLERINAETTKVELVFDSFKRRVLIFLTPTDGVTQGYCHVYDVGSNALWPYRFPLAYGPGATCPIHGSNDEDRRVLIGANDGRVLRFSDSARSDDGAAIETYLDFGSLGLPAGYRNFNVRSISADGAPGSGPVGWSIRAATSASRLIADAGGTPVAAGTWFAGGYDRGRADSVRVASAAIGLRVSQTSDTDTWALSAVRLGFKPGGKVRT